LTHIIGRLADGGIMSQAVHSFIRGFICLFVHQSFVPLLPNLWTRHFENE